jgi:hypothetical protein
MDSFIIEGGICLSPKPNRNEKDVELEKKNGAK